MGGFCLLVELHREGSAPAACAAGLFFKKVCFTGVINPKQTSNYESSFLFKTILFYIFGQTNLIGAPCLSFFFKIIKFVMVYAILTKLIGLAKKTL